MITDAQIRALARGALTAAQHRDCAVALGRHELITIVGARLATWRPSTRDRRAARRRCAALLRGR